MNELEQQKIMLTKEWEKVKEEIDYYGLEKTAEGGDGFKELLRMRDRIEGKIKEIKEELEKQTLSI